MQTLFPGTPNNRLVLIDVWWNNHFPISQCKAFETRAVSWVPGYEKLLNRSKIVWESLLARPPLGGWCSRHDLGPSLSDGLPNFVIRDPILGRLGFPKYLFKSSLRGARRNGCLTGKNWRRWYESKFFSMMHMSIARILSLALLLHGRRKSAKNRALKFHLIPNNANEKGIVFLRLDQTLCSKDLFQTACHCCSVSFLHLGGWILCERFGHRHRRHSTGRDERTSGGTWVHAGVERDPCCTDSRGSRCWSQVESIDSGTRDLAEEPGRWAIIAVFFWGVLFQVFQCCCLLKMVEV